MAGFDYARARTVLGIPEDFTVEAMAAVGKPGRKEELPEDFQTRELPNTRKPLTELVFEGRYRVRLTSRTLRGPEGAFPCVVCSSVQQ